MAINLRLHSRPAALFATAAILVSACSGVSTLAPSTSPSSPAPSSTAATASPSPSASASQPSVAPFTGHLKIWAGQSFSDKQLFDDYTKATGVQVDVTSFPDPWEAPILAKWSAGQRPDILWWHGQGAWMVELDQSRNLLDLSNEPFVSRTTPGLLEAMVGNKGKLYGAVVDAPNVDGVLYNKAVFQGLGIQPPHTFQELLNACDAIKAGAPTVSPIFLAGGDQWPTQLNAYIMWSSAFKADPTIIPGLNTRKVLWTDPRLVQGFQDMKTLWDRGCYNKNALSATYEQSQKALVDGKTAMTFQGDWMIDDLKVAYADKLDAVGFSGISQDGPTTAFETGVTAVAPITGDAAAEAAAKAFLDWITGPGYAPHLARVGGPSVITGVPTPTQIPLKQESLNAYQADSVPEYETPLQAFYGDIDQFLQQMLVGKLTPQQVGETIQREFDKSAKQQGLPGF